MTMRFSRIFLFRPKQPISAVAPDVSATPRRRPILARLSPAMPRGALSARERQKAFYRIGGVCHVCGRDLNYHESKTWVIDHVQPLKQGGRDAPVNYLPACVECNGLRWSYSPTTIRRILLLGVIANFEGFKSNRKSGSAFRAMYANRVIANWLRRHLKGVTESGQRDRLRRRAERMVKGFEDLDEAVMEIQRRTGSSWQKALKQTLKDKGRLEAIYLDLTKIGFNSGRW
jgi:5-methylcytosine-specific restriction endonuclease McrA